MRAPALALALAVAGAAPALAETRDVPWFQARPAVLDETLRRCHRDARLMETHECQNAEAAASGRLGRSGTAQGRATLPEPDYNPRSNPLGWSVLKGACEKRQPGSEMYWPDCHHLSRYPSDPFGGRGAR